jgi:hypothetical protein
MAVSLQTPVSGQKTWLVGQTVWQVPLTHSWPLLQAWLHAPQFKLSDVTLVQAPLQEMAPWLQPLVAPLVVPLAPEPPLLPVPMVVVTMVWPQAVNQTNAINDTPTRVSERAILVSRRMF